MNLEDAMLSERSQTQKARYSTYMNCPRMGKCIEAEQIRGCQALGEGEWGVTTYADKFPLG